MANGRPRMRRGLPQIARPVEDGDVSPRTLKDRARSEYRLAECVTRKAKPNKPQNGQRQIKRFRAPLLRLRTITFAPIGTRRVARNTHLTLSAIGMEGPFLRQICKSMLTQQGAMKFAYGMESHWSQMDGRVSTGNLLRTKPNRELSDSTVRLFVSQ